ALTAMSKSVIHCMPASTVEPLGKAPAPDGSNVTARSGWTGALRCTIRLPECSTTTVHTSGNRRVRAARFHALDRVGGFPNSGGGSGVWSSGVGAGGRAAMLVGLVWRTIQAVRGARYLPTSVVQVVRIGS